MRNLNSMDRVLLFAPDEFQPFVKIVLHGLLMKNEFVNPEAGKLTQIVLFDL